MRQYAASPVIQQLVADRESYFATSWQDDFYSNYWNVDTAQGLGLDYWGQIVVIGRNIQVPATNYFGFHVTPTETYGAFGQSTFYAGQAATNTVTLADNAYRVLILAKALSNIAQTDAKNINKVIQQLFPGRGRAWVNDLGSMSMRFTFEFALEPWEMAVLVSGGVLPRPAGVLAQIVNLPSDTFGFAEQGIGPVVVDGAPLVYRTNWSGEQLLYQTIRTNLLLRSQELENASWTKLMSSVSANITSAPDGTVTADKLVEAAASGFHQAFQAVTGAPSTTYTLSAFFKAAERSFAQMQLSGASIQGPVNMVSVNLSDGSFSATDPSRTTVTNMGGGWYRVSSTATTTAAGGPMAATILTSIALGVSNYAGDGVSGIYVWGGQVEVGSVPTSYIPTAASTASVTDYSATSTAVTLSGPLLAGESLSWSGTYTSMLNGSTVTQDHAYMGSGNGAVSTYRFSGKFSGSGAMPFNQGTFLSNGAVANAN